MKFPLASLALAVALLPCLPEPSHAENKVTFPPAGHGGTQQPAPVGGQDAGHGAAQAAAHGNTAAPAGGHAVGPAAPAEGEALCQGFGPQTPRDIGNPFGRNPVSFGLAPPPEEMNLCNIHTHTNAEHLGPGFSIYAGPGEHGGFKCAGSANLSPAELSRPSGPARFDGVEPGDTIEVHWVYSSCDVAPGPGLGSCLSDSCSNPELRVESQVFLVVNDPNALDFRDFIYLGTMRGGHYQARDLPSGTGAPVVFRGSTTGPSYSQQTCSPLQVTWSVRPRCARLDISTLDAWAGMGNIFEETHSHGVRRLVTAPALLSQIE
ncbi:delta-class carbonic anhydrase [Salipiger sp. H15]|uniref:Delta-class carbonic anhydrase n=1 Tax=Alloyangia sp. H15 TaxID=3029062 RepID=A0AAU8AGY9_9RHOB